ncbi:MAG: phosphoglucosamine mutase [Candidatus Eremiobacteraeota bacterium]|nr:phosphoglucosamine mutase [Candidatus Eremiobacteraeota bacterium]
MSGLFGTDGVRGVANADLTPELVFRIGRAGAAVLAGDGDRHRPIVVGRDTRLSGSMLEAAIVAGITSVGRDVVSLGVVPTPAVACVTRREGAAAGVMISASHNPIADNGVKFFGSDGFKLSDEIENEIEQRIEATDLARPTAEGVGVARVAQNLTRHYYAELYESQADLGGLHVVVDAAYGAAFAIAPYVLRKLGATVTELHCESDGSRINVACGSTDLAPLQAEVRRLRDATSEHVVGVAFDGDADRALFVDETEAVVTGDHVMFAIGTDMHARGELARGAIVGTVMSNIGFERALRAHGIALVRAPVGDRYVLQRLREGGYTLGGEQSGHIIDLRRNTTGDGPMTAMTLLGIVAAKRATLTELVAEVVPAPQILVNVPAGRIDVLERSGVRAAIAAGETALGSSGRLYVRPSGTEPVIRVMVEGDDGRVIKQVAARVAAEIEEEIARLT